MTTAGMQDVTFANGSVTLAGSLWMPDVAGPAVAAVVLVGGSGPTDRDNDVYFPPLRRHLLRGGFAVLSYDKRGVGGSSGDWRAATMDDLAADAAAALDLLRARPGVRSGATGIFGHSEGGWVALRASATRDGLPWVVTSSCPGVSPAVQERHALAGRLRATHRGRRADVDGTLALYDRLVEAGRSDADFATAARLVEAAGGPSPLADFWAGMDEPLWTFLKRKQDHDPAQDLLALRCPHLALFGGADRAIPVADSIHRFAMAACHPARPRRAALTVEVFPGADHRVQVGDPAGLAPGYLDTVTGWLAARSAPASP